MTTVNFDEDIKTIIKDLISEKITLNNILFSKNEIIDNNQLNTLSSDIFTKYISKYDKTKEEEKYDFLLYLIQNFDSILKKENKDKKIATTFRPSRPPPPPPRRR